MTWQTFWLEPTAWVLTGLRRFTWVKGADGWTCAAGWHQAVAWTGQAEARFEGSGDRYVLVARPQTPRGDPRWPAECGQGCGYRFTDGDGQWQDWQELVYQRWDQPEVRYVLHTSIVPPAVPAAPPGASWDSWWMPEAWRGPDGVSLTVRLPRPDGSAGVPHDWLVDGPSSSGGRWTRTGDPRRADVTAAPSIAAGDPAQPGYYHGFLQAGILTGHLG